MTNPDSSDRSSLEIRRYLLSTPCGFSGEFSSDFMAVKPALPLGKKNVLVDFPDQGPFGRGFAVLTLWVELAADAKISHPSLAEPLPVGAILDTASVDDTVARALDAKGNPVIREIRAEGKIEGKAEAILTVLAGRGLHPSGAVRRRILSTTDLATLERWLLKAVTVSSPEEIVED